jgi:hypothetical protein
VVDCLSVTGSCPGENVAATGDAVDSTLLGPGLQIVIAGRLPPTLLFVAFPCCLFESVPRHGSLPQTKQRVHTTTIRCRRTYECLSLVSLVRELIDIEFKLRLRNLAKSILWSGRPRELGRE